MKKDDTAFRDFINDTLEKIYSDGRYAKAWDGHRGQVRLGRADRTDASTGTESQGWSWRVTMREA